jgi:glucose-6-phosphate dehydrogenase assembly protein OpcA
MESLGSPVLVDLESVERQLREMWRAASSEERPVVRASMLTIVVACDTAEDAREATRTVALVSENHPGRALVVSGAREGAPAGEPLAVFVSAHCHRGPGQSVVCSEQVTLEAARSSLPLVPPTLLRLLLPDMPVFVWWRRAALATDPLWEPLAMLSDRFLVDTARHADPGTALQDLVELSRRPAWRGSVGDLAWMRLEPWRETIASFFDSQQTRPHLDGVARVEIAGRGPAGAYLAGWLASRLGWSRGTSPWTWRRRDGRELRVEISHDPGVAPGGIASVRLVAPDGTPPARFSAQRISADSDIVRLAVEIQGTCPLPASLKLVEPDDAALLCRKLERTASDPFFEAALREAAGAAAG